MKKIIYTILSILSVLSGVWSTALLMVIGEQQYFYGLPGSEGNRRTQILMAVIYSLTLLYNVWILLMCQNANQKEEIGKGYLVATIVGLIIFDAVSGFCIFAMVVVSITGGV